MRDDISIYTGRLEASILNAIYHMMQGDEKQAMRELLRHLDDDLPGVARLNQQIENGTLW